MQLALACVAARAMSLFLPAKAQECYLPKHTANVLNSKIAAQHCTYALSCLAFPVYLRHCCHLRILRAAS